MWNVVDGKVLLGTTNNNTGPITAIQDTFTQPGLILSDQVLHEGDRISRFFYMTGVVRWISTDEKSKNLSEWRVDTSLPAGSLYFADTQPKVWTGALTVFKRSMHVNWCATVKDHRLVTGTDKKEVDTWPRVFKKG
jgi:hypothetical protein